MKPKLLILLLFIARIGWGQAFITNKANKLTIYTLPISAIDEYGGLSYTLGAEFRLRNNMALCIQGGGYYLIFHGYSTRVEMKYYINNTGENVGKYISFEAFYKNLSYTWTRDTIHLSPPYVKPFTINKSVECFDIKFGGVKVFNSGIFTDFYLGVGVRYKQATTTLSPLEYSKVTYDDAPGDYGAYGFMNYVGNAAFLDIKAGIKVGYTIK